MGSHMVAIDVSPISAGGYGLRYEGKIELPKLMNRWNVEKMVEETLKEVSRVSFSLESLARWRASRLLPSLKTPGMCVLRPRLAALSFMLNKSGAEPGFVRCSGLPVGHYGQGHHPNQGNCHEESAPDGLH